MTSINLENVRFIIDKAHEFQMLDSETAQDAGEEPDPAYAELKAAINDLEPDQQASLVGLMWLGRGDYAAEDWQRALKDARDGWNTRTAEYLIQTPLLADYLTEGLEQLGARRE
ncbi:MAG TPA: DUF3775 domain-containing protein [Gammaproteobacteria bacterium]|nr:DUF3775 domain-containing protein [Gammaproteobacteria bacterium]